MAAQTDSTCRMGLLPDTEAALRAELERRFTQEIPDYLCSVWVRNRMNEDADRETERLIERLRSIGPTQN